MRVIAALLSLVIIAFAAMPVRAFAEGGAVFSLKPAHPDPAKRETTSYFAYSMKPGDSLNDEAFAVNSGTSAVHLKIYPADGLTSANGGIGFPNSDKARTEAGTWVELSTSDITLQPGEQQTIGLRVSVPTNVPPKQYVAGVVLENADLVKGSGGVAVNILQRTATAIVITVGGPLSESMEIEGVDSVARGNGTTLTARMVNNSDSLVVPTAITIEVLDLSGKVLAALPATGGTILPGDRIEVSTSYDKPLKAGTHSFYAKAEYGHGKIVTWPKPKLATAPIDTTVKAIDSSGAPLKTIPGRIVLSVSPSRDDTVVTFPIVLPQGSTIGSLSSAAGVNLTGNRLTMPLDYGSGNSGMQVVVALGRMSATENGVQAKVDSITVKTADETEDFSAEAPDLGTLTAWAEADVRTLDVGDVVKFDVTREMDERGKEKLRAAAARRGLAVLDIACVLNAAESGPKNLFGVGTARVIMLLSGPWAETQGLDGIRLVGISKSGTAEVLETHVAIDADGRYRIEAISPHEYAAFGLIATGPAAHSNASILILLVGFGCILALAVLTFAIIRRRRHQANLAATRTRP